MEIPLPAAGGFSVQIGILRSCPAPFAFVWMKKGGSHKCQITTTPVDQVLRMTNSNFLFYYEGMSFAFIRMRVSFPEIGLTSGVSCSLKI